METNVFKAGLLFILTISLSLVVLADDSILTDHGKTVSPEKVNEVAMIEEDVVIIMTGEVESFYHEALVRCTFLFRNTTEKPINAVVGFPGYDCYSNERYSEPIQDFLCTINGKKYSIVPRKEVFMKDDNGEWSRNWYTWQMTFPANEIISVKNQYTQKLSTGSGYDPYLITYELSTGANWKGTIGKVTIRVIYPNEDDLERRICTISPKGWNREKNQIVWSWTNLEPTLTDNIRIEERNLAEGFWQNNWKPLLFKKDEN